jgi:parallel beta-helix repeat protein
MLELRTASDWFAALQFESVDEPGDTVTIRTTRNAPSWASLGDEIVSADTWYKFKLVATGIGTSSGTLTFYINDVSEKSASSIDWSAGYTITSVRLGDPGGHWGSAPTAGTVYFDDGWVDADGSGGGVANTWSATVATEPKIVLFNGTRGTNVASQAACDGAMDWYWVSNTLYTYGTEDPSTTYTSPGVEAAVRNAGIDTNGVDYIAIDGISVSAVNQFGIHVNGSDESTVENCSTTQSYYDGIRVTTSTDVTVDSCTVSHAGGVGINATGDADAIGDITISNNTVHDGGWNAADDAYVKWNAGIKVWGGANYGDAGESDVTLIEGNTVYNQADQFGDISGSGIWLDQWGNDGVIRYNKTYNNEAYGIILENPLAGASPIQTIYYNLSYGNLNGISVNRDASDIQVYNNTIYNNTNGGLICEGYGIQTDMDDNIFRNNISVGNGTNLVAILGCANDDDGTGNAYSNNAFGAEASDFIEWGDSTFYSTYDAWESAYGGTTNSIEADPLMIDPANGNFRLRKGSPAVNTGVNVGLTSDINGKPVPRKTYPNIGAHENRVDFPFGPSRPE